MVTAEPEVTVRKVTADDEFVVIACDGVLGSFRASLALKLVQAYGTSSPLSKLSTRSVAKSPLAHPSRIVATAFSMRLFPQCLAVLAATTCLLSSVRYCRARRWRSGRQPSRSASTRARATLFQKSCPTFSSLRHWRRRRSTGRRRASSKLRGVPGTRGSHSSRSPPSHSRYLLDIAPRAEGNTSALKDSTSQMPQIGAASWCRTECEAKREEA